MLSVDTVPGSRYSVKTARGCDVFTPAGQVICRALPGILGCFSASGYVTCFSDDAAVVQLVSSGVPGGTGGYQLTISQALAAATRAEESARAAEESRVAAEAAEADASVSRAGANAAQEAAEAAQRKAEQEASKAEAAAAAAEAPESLAVQAARPATMLLVKDELMSVLGDASSFDLDTDGQKIIVHTDRLEEERLRAVTDMLERFVPQFIDVVQYNHHIEVSWRDINKYAKCVTVSDVQAVNPDYKNDLTADGEWLYHLDSLETAQDMFRSSKIKIFRCRTPKILTARAMFHSCASLEIIDADLSSITDIYDFCFSCKKLSVCTSEFPNIGIQHFMAFFGTQLDKESAVRIINSLPPMSSTFYIGIHVDYKNDSDVLAAISNAESRKWKFSITWNGTTTSGASTMAMGQLIYAKVSEHELPDGTTERVLDWGHYVTDWEARDYEQFRSLASAYVYFGLPMPEDLTNN